MDLKTIQKSQNVADLLDPSELGKIGQTVIRGYEVDEESRAEWKELVDKATDIAKQTLEIKNHPWPNASNVKIPIITEAAIDFASRTFPLIVNSDKVVQAAVIGSDPTGQKEARARRISDHMSYQLLLQSDQWEEDMDRLLHVLPVLGTAFKKTYFCPIKRVPISEMCHPDRIVVNYNVNSLQSARRVSHVVTCYLNDIIEKMRSGIYREVDYTKLWPEDVEETDKYAGQIELIEQHCYLDLDEDGYQEPYIVVVHKQSGEVLRIVQRFKEVDVKDGKVVSIIPQHFFTDYHFIKSPDGGFYSIGLGTLLYPFNAAINTLANQLIDAGTMNNLQGGFVGSGVRLKKKELQATMGVWNSVESSNGVDLAKNIVPFPTKEPSNTLFALLQMLVKMGQELSSINDVMQGNIPGQNVPATTVLTMVEQGMKVFNAVHKRLYRSLRMELKKIASLNHKYLTDKEYQNVLDVPARVKEDYEDKSIDILPVVDPVMSSTAQRIAKAQAIASLPGVNQYEASKYFLDALQLDQNVIDKILPPPDPNAPPSPETLKVLAETDKFNSQAKQAMAEAMYSEFRQQLEAQKLQIQTQDSITRQQDAASRIMKNQADAANNSMKLELATGKALEEAELERMRSEASAVSNIMEAETNRMKVQVDAEHKAAKLEQNDES